jgi:hypothetical protein
LRKVSHAHDLDQAKGAQELEYGERHDRTTKPMASSSTNSMVIERPSRDILQRCHQ